MSYDDDDDDSLPAFFLAIDNLPADCLTMPSSVTSLWADFVTKTKKGLCGLYAGP